VFSLSPTKVVTAIEGGLLTTDDEVLANKVRAMRDYGKDLEQGEEMVYLGLSARMSELHAAVGLLSLRQMDKLVKARLERIAVYRDRLGHLPGCWVQWFPSDRTTSGNFFVLFITARARHSRNQVYEALKKRGIQTKAYFNPPVHQQRLFRNTTVRVSARLSQTEKVSEEALALPLYSHMTQDEQDRVCCEIEKLLA